MGHNVQSMILPMAIAAGIGAIAEPELGPAASWVGNKVGGIFGQSTPAAAAGAAPGMSPGAQAAAGGSMPTPGPQMSPMTQGLLGLANPLMNAAAGGGGSQEPPAPQRPAMPNPSVPRQTGPIFGNLPPTVITGGQPQLPSAPPVNPNSPMADISQQNAAYMSPYYKNLYGQLFGGGQ